MKKIHLKKKYHYKKTTILMITIVLIVIAINFTFSFINNKVTPILFNYASLETKKLASIIINKAISKQLTDEVDVDKLFIITKNDDGEIKTIDFNPTIVNQFLVTITNTIQLNLKYIEQGNIELIELPDDVLVDYDKDELKEGIVFKIPSGIVFNNPLLSNLGPKIPVRLNLVGDILSNIDTKVTNYGINNVLLEVSVKIEVNEQIILPFTSKKTLVQTSAPIAIKVIQGSIPNYYFNGMDQSSPILTVPIE